MGFQVETAASGLQALIKASQHRPDVLVIDRPHARGVWTFGVGISARYREEVTHVMVVTGNPGQEIAERCEGFDASCIQKGHNFWNEFEAGLYRDISAKGGCNNEVGQAIGKNRG